MSEMHKADYKAWAITLIQEVKKNVQYLKSKTTLTQKEVEMLIDQQDLLTAWKLDAEKEQ